MPENVILKKKIERRTYLKGKFKGKFMGYLNFRKSDLKHENYYDIEILSGEIAARKSDLLHWKSGEPIKYQPIDKFLTKLPDSLPLSLKDEGGDVKHYNVNLNDAKLTDYELSYQQYEGNKVWGTIEGEISGFLKHYETADIDVGILSEKVKTNKQTGRKEVKGNYIRWEYFFSDGTTYWGEWQYQGGSDGVSIWGFLLSLLALLFLLFIVVPLFVAGWQVLLPLIIMVGVFYLLSILQPVILFIGKWLLRFAGLAFIVFMLYGVYALLTSPIHSRVKQEVAEDDAKEVTDIKPNPNLIGDSIISHYRIWEDYNDRTYEGYIQVKVSDFNSSSSIRNSLQYSLSSPEEYNRIVSSIHDFDKSKLSLVYLLFDSLKMKYSLNDIQFAEMIGTFVQDIPYTLLLDGSCSPHQYNDNFIRKYLGEGGRCEGNIKYGLLTPVEFMGTLCGDCDTRTLLLFTIFNHYGYDVAMLGSELHKHSIIGINLPFNGKYKMVDGRRYIIWETTEKGLIPGYFPSQLSDMRFWNVNLISNNLSI